MAHKRSHGTGSVTAYKDGFRLRWSTPDGGRGTKVLRGVTRKQAEAVLRSILADLEKGSFHDERKGNIKFEEFAKDYLAWKEPQVKHSTFKNYGPLLKTTLLPTFAGKKLHQITRRQVDIWWSQQAQHRVNRRNAYYLLRKIFELAIDWDLIAASPCRVKNPGKDEAKPRPDWTLADFDAVLQEVDPFYRDALEVMFAGHFRLGELIALNGSDVRGGFVTVDKQKTKGGYTTGTKTGQHKRIALLERGRLVLAARPAVIGDAPLFTGERAYRMPRKSLQKAWNAACKAAGFGNFHLHDVRHVSLSLMAEAGTDRKVIQQRAGHASATSTDRYIHTSQRQHAQAVADVDALVKKVSGT